MYIQMRIILIASLVLVGHACTQSHQVTDSKSHKDSLEIGGQYYYLDSIGADYFERVTIPAIQVKPDTGIVHIYPDSIVVKSNAKNVCFKNDTSEGESAVTYAFIAMYLNQGYVHIAGTHWEWTSDHVINIRTGSDTECWEDPVLSPGKDKFFVFSSDLVAGFMPNGIQLFTVNADTIVKVFEKEIESWGPEQAKWESDTSVLIKRLKLDDNMQSHYDYVRMVLK